MLLGVPSPATTVALQRTCIAIVHRDKYIKTVRSWHGQRVGIEDSKRLATIMRKPPNQRQQREISAVSTSLAKHPFFQDMKEPDITRLVSMMCVTLNPKP